MGKINIFLVDDHQLIRDGIKALLNGVEGINIVGEASSGKELFLKLNELRPDILILDISLPDISGIDITRTITEDYPTIRVLILSMYTDEHFILNAVKAGARGYLPKNTTRDELLEAIVAIYNGDEFFGESISRIILKSYVRKAKEEESLPQKTQVNLTSREIEILKLVAEGFINKEISNHLDISIRTVETHKNHIMKKLEMKSIVELIKYAIRNKIVEI
jgi:DNA-binding NarL/FixJ family response regulator